MGMTDAGYPLHLVVVSRDSDFDFASIHKKNKRSFLLITAFTQANPMGSMQACCWQEIFTERLSSLKTADRYAVLCCIIPVYNIGGCLDSSADYRVDQNGPEEFGFRGQFAKP